MNRRLRAPLLASVSSVTMLLIAGPAVAGESGHSPYIRGGTQAAQAAAVARATRGGVATAAAQRALAAFGRAAAVRSAMDASQRAARAAAAAAVSNIPNGLGAGGLQVANGAATDQSLWTGADRPTQVVNQEGTLVTVRQTRDKAILTWDSFNVGRETTLDFNQSAGGANAANWIALNRLSDVNADPSRILGRIKAQGQVYLINRNGVIFGGASQVNVHSLIAASLDFTGDTLAARNQRFVDGILYDPTSGSSYDRATFSVNADQPAIADSAVRVEAGAVLTMSAGGRAVLVGPTVTNAGTITSPDGQVVLAAGRRVELRPNYGSDALFGKPPTFDPDLRGIEVSIGPDAGGTAINDGALYADRGNITIAGRTVTHNGLIQATTSGTANGSVTLYAGDSGTVEVKKRPDVGGALTLGKGSTIQILPDANGAPAIGFDQYRSSKIDLIGGSIVFDEGATLYAPGARVTAATTRFNYLTGPGADRIYVANGATIDVSGLFVNVPASRNSIQGELRAAELRDNPILRNSFLRGQTIYFDARRGTELADLSGYYNLISRDVSELMTGGGSLTFAGTEVITRAGSTVNLSGGALNYGGGYVRSSLLVDQFGRVTAIEDAQAGVNYVGFYGDFVVDHSRWGFSETFRSPFASARGRYEAAYTEGRAAGSLTIGAGDRGSRVRVLDGAVLGDVTVGTYQRQAPTGAPVSDVVATGRERPLNASLTLGTTNGASGAARAFGGANYVIGDAAPLAAGFTVDSEIAPDLVGTTHLSSTLFGDGGFGNVTLYSGKLNGELGGSLLIEEGAQVRLGDFGSFRFFGDQARMDGRIVAAGGTVSLLTIGQPIAGATTPQISVGGTIDVAGGWVNDLLPTAGSVTALATNGGSINLQALTGVELRRGSLLDVSGGGQLTSEGALRGGDGGAISIVANVVSDRANGATAPATVTLDGTLRGYALGKGSTLTISTAGVIAIGDKPVAADGALAAGIAAPSDLVLNAPLAFGVGDTIPFGFSLTLTSLQPGYPTPTTFTPNLDFGNPLPVGADFIVPDGILGIYTEDGGAYFPGDTVPSGSRISFLDGDIPAGSVFPADAFPNGIPIVAKSVTVAAGVTDRPLTLTSGTIIPRGATLDRDVSVDTPLLFTPDTFRSGGFANLELAGASGVAVLSGTTLRPDVASAVLPDDFARLPTGTRIADLVTTQVRPVDLAEPTRLTLSTIWLDPVTGEYAGDTGETPRTGVGRIDVQTGTSILTSPGSTVRLVGDQGVAIDGTIAAPGGLIEASTGGIGGPPGTPEAPGAVTLGRNARLLAPGYVRSALYDGAVRRSVENAGAVRLNVNTAVIRSLGTPRYVITDPDSVIDVSGVVGTADFIRTGPASPGTSPFVSTLVGSDAGTVEINATDGIVAGRIDLSPGDAMARGGTLSIRAARDPYYFGGGRTGIPTLTVVQSLTDGLALFPATFDPDARGLVAVADRINASGADTVRLGADAGNLSLAASALVFGGDVSLSARRELELGASTITNLVGDTGDVRLTAGYIAIVSPQENGRGAATRLPTGTDLVGSLTLDAKLIDVVSGVDFGCGDALCADQRVGQGFADIAFRSAGDIRLISPQSSSTGISAGGRLTFTSAQVYAAGSSFRRTDDGFLIHSDQSITFTGNGRVAPMPLSFGGKITVDAATIVQSGVLRAPLGEIDFRASEAVTLAPGSITSTSLGGVVVPYGSVDSDFTFPDTSVLPISTINLAAPNVTVATGARLDVSGDGDIVAAQFVAGNGGSANILASGKYFALVPTIRTGPAPYLENPRNVYSTEFTNDGLRVGDTVHLDGSATLPAGTYTLLPAAFAALPGGILVAPSGNGGLAGSIGPIARPDGSYVVSGYRSDSFTGLRDRDVASFVVVPRAVWQQRSQVNLLSYNNAVIESAAKADVVARTALDAGTVVLGATETLVLNGSGDFTPATGGLSGGLDISAGRIAIVSADIAAPEGYLAVDARGLSAFGAGSVLIGGVRSGGNAGTLITTNASDVLIANDAANPLTGAEYLFAATDRLTFGPGATVTASGTAPAQTDDLIIAGNGGFVRVSSGGRTGFSRTDADGSAGIVDIQGGARLTAAGALLLDASGNLLLDSDSALAARQLDLSSVTVSLGDVPGTVTGTVLSERSLAALAGVADLGIRGSRSIDFYGDFILGEAGGRRLGSLTLDTPLLRGFSATGERARISAGTVTLRNGGGAADEGTSAGGGTFDIATDQLTLGDGAVALRGFSTTNVTAGRVVADGRGTLNATGSMRIATDLVTAAGGSDYALSVADMLTVVAAGGKAGLVDDFGGRLSLTGTSLSFDTTASLPAGILELSAADGNLSLGDRATIDVSGVAQRLRDVTRMVSGGTVRLGASGAIAMADGAAVNVAGAAAGGNGGRVAITAGGDASLAGRFTGGAQNGYTGGNLDVRVGRLTDFAGFNAALETGGMTGTRAIDVATGDLTLAQGQTITAHDVLLHSRSGRVDIAGTIDAAGDAGHRAGGDIRLIGGNGVTLAGTARLDASAAAADRVGFAPGSGSVDIRATGGRVSLANGSTIAVAGGRQGGGTVFVGAARDVDDVAVDAFGSTITGARDVAVAGFATYRTGTIDAAAGQRALAEAAGWGGNAGAIADRLGLH